jgi:hypothetical protein
VSSTTMVWPKALPDPQARQAPMKARKNTTPVTLERIGSAGWEREVMIMQNSAAWIKCILQVW